MQYIYYKCIRDHEGYPVEPTTDTVNIASGQSEVTYESPGGEKMDKTIPE